MPIAPSAPDPSPRVTSVDVARRAGVSQSTVSRYFAGAVTVAARTGALIEAAAAALDYTPNAIARSLITSRTRLVGVVLPGITNLVLPELLYGLGLDLRAEGLRPLLFPVEQEQDIDEVVPHVLEYQVDGIISAGRLSAEMAETCRRRHVPVVLLNRHSRDVSTCSVGTDHVEGGRLLATLLVEAGHRRPAVITGPSESPSSRERMRGFLDRLEELGVECVDQASADFTYEGGAEAARALSGANGARLDAICCANDTMALGAIDVLRHERQLNVPEDVSVVGFDGIPAGGWASYGLTTIRQRLPELTRAAIELLVQRTRDPNLPNVRRLIPGELVVRSSARLPALALLANA